MKMNRGEKARETFQVDHRKGRKPAKPRSKSGKVETQQVDPRVMKAARKAAKGDMSRLRILGPRRVEIMPPKD